MKGRKWYLAVCFFVLAGCASTFTVTGKYRISVTNPQWCDSQTPTYESDMIVTQSVIDKQTFDFDFDAGLYLLGSVSVIRHQWIEQRTMGDWVLVFNGKFDGRGGIKGRLIQDRQAKENCVETYEFQGKK